MNLANLRVTRYKQDFSYEVGWNPSGDFVGGRPRCGTTAAGHATMSFRLPSCMPINYAFFYNSTNRGCTSSTRLSFLPQRIYKRCLSWKAASSVGVLASPIYESFLLNMIMKVVKFIGLLTLHNWGRPMDDYTPAEKSARKVFMDQDGFGTSSKCQ